MIRKQTKRIKTVLVTSHNSSSCTRHEEKRDDERCVNELEIQTRELCVTKKGFLKRVARKNSESKSNEKAKATFTQEVQDTLGAFEKQIWLKLSLGVW